MAPAFPGDRFFHAPTRLVSQKLMLSDTKRGHDIIRFLDRLRMLKPITLPDSRENQDLLRTVFLSYTAFSVGSGFAGIPVQSLN
jgi:hypothetical protein